MTFLPPSYLLAYWLAFLVFRSWQYFFKLKLLSLAIKSDFLLLCKVFNFRPNKESYLM